MTYILCGDPAPDHAAALLRRPGTHNSKYNGEARLCQILHEGSPVDITEIEALVDLYDRPIFEFKPKSNGHGPETDAGGLTLPVDVEARLAAMQWHSSGDNGIHLTQRACTASLLRAGQAVDSVVAEVLEATRRAVANDPEAADWDWAAEQHDIERMSYDFINNLHPELCELLPNPLLQKWREREAAGDVRIRVGWVAFARKWSVFGRRPSAVDTDEAAADDTNDVDSDEQPDARKKLRLRCPVIYSSSEFVKGFTPPDYLVDGVLQRRFIYALTGKTGDGKTAVILLLAYCVAEGQLFGGHICERGTVFILVGENPDDVRMRWIGLAHAMKFDLGNVDVHFIPGVFPIADIRAEVEREAKAKKREISLLIVDTSAAYFPGNDENSNTQLGGHARILREAFVQLPGQPCVIVTNHPIKSPDMDNLLPRGGGAYVAEVDGNLVGIRSENTTMVHWHGKFRGPDFEPMYFELMEVTAPDLVDSKGRSIPTVIARELSEDSHTNLRAKARAENNTVLLILAVGPEDMSTIDIALAAGWVNKRGEANKMRVRHCLNRLRDGKMVKLELGSWRVTDAGKKAALRARQRQEREPA